jgi:two-component system, OmpR family, sensor histidine kinase TctE
VFRRPDERRSLLGDILDWMLAPLLLLWPMSIALTWVVAQGIANRPYDRDLGERVRALARQVAVGPQRRVDGLPLVRLELDERSTTLLGIDDEERMFFQILGARGELLVGEPKLAVPEVDSVLGVVRYRDDEVRGEPVRVAWLWLPDPARRSHAAALVQLAETLDQRSKLATDIIKGVILPQFVILPVAVLLAWFALTRSLHPLTELQQRIRRRDSGDLSPIDPIGVPEEVSPLVAAINDLLARLDQSLSTQRHFLADAAHQLKTPLAGLRTQAELAERELDSGRGDTASLKHSLQQIALSTQRTARMVNQLLAMSRAEHAEQALRKEEVDLAELTRETVRDFVPRALDRSIDLGYEGPQADNGSDAAARLVGHPVLLRELIRNLVDNALLYTPAGGTVTARVTAEAAGQALLLQVEDNGPGIPAAERALVFRSFYRALGTGVDGSGLGLAIVQEIALQHGAEVGVDDTRPAPAGGTPGARFTVRFPLPPQSADPAF